MTNYYTFQSPIGLLYLSEENNRLTHLYPIQNESELDLSLKNEMNSDFLYEAYTQINEYFAGKRRSFNLPVSFSGTPFQQQVWRQLQTIPYGETRSYQDIAVGIGNPKAVRAVGQANNKNSILIVVPCHRVIHKNGDITGFGCGTEVKKYLLNLEKGY